MRDGDREAAEIAHPAERFEHQRQQVATAFERQPDGIGADRGEDLRHDPGHAQLADGIADRAVEAGGAIDLEQAVEELRVCLIHETPNEDGGACAPPSILAMACA